MCQEEKFPKAPRCLTHAYSMYWTKTTGTVPPKPAT